MKLFKIRLFTILLMVSTIVMAVDDPFHEEQELRSLFANFEQEDICCGKKIEIINRLLESLDLEKNSEFPMLEKLKSGQSSFIQSQHPVKFSFTKHYRNRYKQDIKYFIEDFNREVARLAKILGLKVDGDTSLPLASIVLVLTWDPNIHLFLQDSYALLENNDITISDEPYGQYDYCLTTYNAASLLMINYLKKFTDMDDRAITSIEKKHRYILIQSYLVDCQMHLQNIKSIWSFEEFVGDSDSLYNNGLIELVKIFNKD